MTRPQCPAISKCVCACHSEFLLDLAGRGTATLAWPMSCFATTPGTKVVGLGGLEPPASPLSGVRSNHLSYRPVWHGRQNEPILADALISDGRCRLTLNLQVTCVDALKWRSLSLKEVIQPHLPIRLPCYDFTPVMNHSVASALLTVTLPASGATHSHGVTGGVYKARERIHRDNADSRLLAIPTSRSRVADSDPD